MRAPTSPAPTMTVRRAVAPLARSRCASRANTTRVSADEHDSEQPGAKQQARSGVARAQQQAEGQRAHRGYGHRSGGQAEAVEHDQPQPGGVGAAQRSSRPTESSGNTAKGNRPCVPGVQATAHANARRAPRSRWPEGPRGGRSAAAREPPRAGSPRPRRARARAPRASWSQPSSLEPPRHPRISPLAGTPPAAAKGAFEAVIDRAAESSSVWLYEAERRSLTAERGGHAKLNQGLGGW